MTAAQLVQLADDWRGALPEGGVMAEQKIDGFRAARFPGITGITRLWTRNGHPIEGTAHILYRLDQIERVAGVPLFFDGEFQVAGTLDATKRWCESGWRMGGEAGIYHLFDAMPLVEWKAGGCDTPLFERKAALARWIEEADADPTLSWEWRPGSRGRDEGAIPVVLLEDEWCASPREVMDLARRVWAEGGEGLVLKDAMAPYRRNRNDAWMKVKADNQHKWRMAA